MKTILPSGCHPFQDNTIDVAETISYAGFNDDDDLLTSIYANRFVIGTNSPVKIATMRDELGMKMSSDDKENKRSNPSPVTIVGEWFSATTPLPRPVFVREPPKEYSGGNLDDWLADYVENME